MAHVDFFGWPLVVPCCLRDRHDHKTHSELIIENNCLKVVLETKAEGLKIKNKQDLLSQESLLLVLQKQLRH